MTGVGRAYGAITVLNATATGHGCSLATDHGIEAAWEWIGDARSGDPEGFDWQTPGIDDALARAVWVSMQEHLGIKSGAKATTRSRILPGRGLKTSSSAATALIRAAAAAHQQSPGPREVERLAVQSTMAAGVTITGAYDDQVAVTRGGCHLTDNDTLQILHQAAIPCKHVAVWVPEASIAKRDIMDLDTAPIQDDIRLAEKAVLAGDIGDALRRNGEAFHRLYEAAGLPVTREPVKVAMEYGALAAGLSGTGPAVSALFDDIEALPHTRGGVWMWMKTVEAQA